MNAPARVRQQEQEAPPVEIPQPILWNLANARSELLHARKARADMTALDPAIERLEKELAKLKSQHRDLGEVETLHIFNARLSFQMADQTAENGRYPRPQTFEDLEIEAAGMTLPAPAAPDADQLVADGDPALTRPFVPAELES